MILCDIRQKTYVLTPYRKRLGNAVARKCQQGIAEETMKNPSTRKRVLNLVGRELQKEVQKMASDSTNSLLKMEDLKEFEWDKLLQELSTHAPVLLGVLQAATKTRSPRTNTNAVICICAAIIFKQRNSKMSLVQKIISLVLYAGHTSVQV